MRSSCGFCLLTITIYMIGISLFCGFTCAKQKIINPVEILEKLDPAQITLEEIDTALPRLKDENILLRLRGGRRDFQRRYEYQVNDTLKKSLIIGAYFTASKWDWCFLLKNINNDHQVDSLKYPIDQNLSAISHELKSIGYPNHFLRNIDELGDLFESSVLHKPDIFYVSDRFELIEKQLYQFFLGNREMEEAYRFGNWLVDIAQLSNLYPKFKAESREKIITKINGYLKKMDAMFVTMKKIFGSDYEEYLHPLYKLFPVQIIDDVEAIHSHVQNIFFSLNLYFPKIT